MSRPTELQFRSPKQKTPDFYRILVTQDGGKLLESKSKQHIQEQMHGGFEHDLNRNCGSQENLYIKNIQSNLEKKASFSTSQSRFPQYDQWAKKTGIFLGPGVYDDHETYKNLTKQPCTSIFKSSYHGSNASGKEGYTMIANNLLMYDPGFDRSRQKRVQDSLTGQTSGQVQMKNVFNTETMNQIKMTRNSLGGNSQTYNIGYPQRLNTSFRKRSNNGGSRQEVEQISTDVKERPQTSYSNSRKGLSTQSQSRNLTRTNFQNSNSQHTKFTDSDGAKLRYQNSIPQTRNIMQFQSSASESDINRPMPLKQNSLRGFEIQNIGNAPFEYQDYHQPRENINIKKSNRDSDPLVNVEDLDYPQRQNFALGSGINQVRPYTTGTLQKRRSGSTNPNSKRAGTAASVIQDLKKSVGLLQAYGEYQRFISISKKFMRDRGIVQLKVGKKRKSKRHSSHQVGATKGRDSRARDSTEANTQERLEETSPNNDIKYAEMNRILNEKLSSDEV